MKKHGIKMTMRIIEIVVSNGKEAQVKYHAFNNLKLKLYKSIKRTGWKGWLEDENKKALAYIRPDGNLVFEG